MTFVSYVLKDIRKIIGHPLIERASRIYATVSPDVKSNKQMIHDTIAKNLNGNILTTIYIKSDPNDRLKSSLVKFKPDLIEH
jgi:CMP-N-acetylneuraminic acid synthetase